MICFTFEPSSLQHVSKIGPPMVCCALGTVFGWPLGPAEISQHLMLSWTVVSLHILFKKIQIQYWNINVNFHAADICDILNLTLLSQEPATRKFCCNEAGEKAKDEIESSEGLLTWKKKSNMNMNMIFSFVLNWSKFVRFLDKVIYIFKNLPQNLY